MKPAEEKDKTYKNLKFKCMHNYRYSTTIILHDTVAILVRVYEKGCALNLTYSAVAILVRVYGKGCPLN